MTTKTKWTFERKIGETWFTSALEFDTSDGAADAAADYLKICAECGEYTVVRIVKKVNPA